MTVKPLPCVSDDLKWVRIPARFAGEKRWELAWAEPRDDAPLIDDGDFVGDD